MHSIIVLVWCLRVNLPEIEWRIDLPELISIQLGTSAFRFTDDKSSELIMRSDDGEMNWWIDLPKLTTLTANGNRSYSFQYPRSITLESAFCLFILTSRHALSHWCVFLSRISLPGQRCSFWRSASFHLVHSKILVISLIMLCHFHNETVIKSSLSSNTQFLYLFPPHEDHPIHFDTTLPLKETVEFKEFDRSMFQVPSVQLHPYNCWSHPCLHYS